MADFFEENECLAIHLKAVRFFYQGCGGYCGRLRGIVLPRVDVRNHFTGLLAFYPIVLDHWFLRGVFRFPLPEAFAPISRLVCPASLGPGLFLVRPLSNEFEQWRVIRFDSIYLALSAGGGRSWGGLSLLVSVA